MDGTKSVTWNEVSQTEKQKHGVTTVYVESKQKWYKWTYKIETHRLTDLEKESMGAGGRGSGRDS